MSGVPQVFMEIYISQNLIYYVGDFVSEIEISDASAREIGRLS